MSSKVTVTSIVQCTTILACFFVHITYTGSCICIHLLV